MQATTPMTSKQSPKETELNAGSDGDMKVELVVNERAEAIIFHDKPFKKTLSWLEFDLDSNKLDFIMNDGDLRNFGIPVHPDLSKYMQNAFQVLMVLMDDKTGEPEEGNYFPLIIHRG
jgi:hypothetical protein